MKVKLQDIIDAVDFDSEMSESYLNRITGEVCVFSYEEIQAAEEDEDLSDSPEWYRDAVVLAKKYIENQDDYLALPEKYEFDEYRIMEMFILRIENQKQSDMLFQAIKGKAAFRRFKEVLERLALIDQWYKFKDQKLTDFVKLWCEENSIRFE